MISPNDDKLAIKAILDTDSYIQEAGFLAKNIKTTKYGTDTLNSSDNDLQIFIYNGTPINTNSWIRKGVVFNVVVVGKRAQSRLIDSVVHQVIALLTNQNIGRGNILYLNDPPIELDSDPAIYSVETSFVCYETIYNSKKY